MNLQVAKANQDQIVECFKNVHEVWPHASSLEEHLRLRLDSAQHKRADWFVGTADEKVVTSLGRYPLEIKLDDNSYKAIGIGAVHTPLAFRKKGYANILLEQVLAQSKKEGYKLALLFSDIDPEYYGRLGFKLLPSVDFTLEVDGKVAGFSDTLYSFEMVNSHDHISLLSDIYKKYTDKFSLTMSRPQDYWEWLFKKQSLETVLVKKKERLIGYFIYSKMKDELKLEDYALDLGVETDLSSLFVAMVSYATKYNMKLLKGWVEMGCKLPDFLFTRTRDIEMPMILSLDSSLSGRISDCVSSSYFQSLDHY